MRLELNTGRRLLLALCAALSLAHVTSAQEQTHAGKVTDYVNQFTSCNAGAHLDLFAIELQNNPNATGHIIIYGPPGPEKKYAERAVSATKSYLVNARGIEESRLQAIYAGPYCSVSEILTELWLVPEGAKPPPRTKYKPDLAFEGNFYETELWDGPDLVGEVTGWSTSSEVAFVGLNEMMSRRKDASVYLVAYHDNDTAPGTWRRAAERQTEVMRRYGFPAERVKVIFGGYAGKASLQVWVLPSDAPPPAKHRSERRPKRSVQIASLDENMLKFEADWAFKGLVDVLKTDEQLTACLVVRHSPAEPEDADPEQPVDPDEPPPVDLLKLTEKWKAEFRKKGIGEHRLIIMVAPTRGYQWGAEMETWVVPPGALLPDASADVEEEEAAENP